MPKSNLPCGQAAKCSVVIPRQRNCSRQTDRDVRLLASALFVSADFATANNGKWTGARELSWRVFDLKVFFFFSHAKFFLLPKFFFVGEARPDTMLPSILVSKRQAICRFLKHQHNQMNFLFWGRNPQSYGFQLLGHPDCNPGSEPGNTKAISRPWPVSNLGKHSIPALRGSFVAGHMLVYRLDSFGHSSFLLISLSFWPHLGLGSVS